MDTRKRRTRCRVQHRNGQSVRRRTSVTFQRDRSKKAFRRLTDRDIEGLADACRITRSRLSHKRNDEVGPVEMLDTIIQEKARLGHPRQESEALILHFTETIARAYGSVAAGCLSDTIVMAQAVDSEDDVLKMRALASGLATEELQRLRAGLTESIAHLRVLYIQTGHVLSERAA